ncbi:MAG: ABC-F family ATP-binding cassette domain-containing protein [Patescibacteria group bacterium]
MRKESFSSKEQKIGQTVLSLNNVSLFKGEQEILNNISFVINKGDHIAMVGPNGVGKTTLFKCILGLEEPDGGNIVVPKNTVFGYVPQAIDNTNLSSIRNEITIKDYIYETKKISNVQKELDYFESLFARKGKYSSKDLGKYGSLQERFDFLGGWKIESDAKEILYGINFPKNKDLDTKISKLSGGEKTKLFIAGAIISANDLLLLDEPTNHLDQNSLDWLSKYLKSFRGAILVISHIPSFLEQFVTKVIEISPISHKAEEYVGNYSQYLSLKNIKFNSEVKLDKKKQNEINKLNKIVNKLRAGSKAKMAKDREKKILKLKKDLPNVNNKQNRISIHFKESEIRGKKVISFSGITKKFGETLIDFSSINIEIQNGEKIAMIGPVGAGKTTLLKILAGKIYLDSGQVNITEKIKIGYYSQELDNLDVGNTVLEEFKKDFPKLPDQMIRNNLGSFMFSNYDVFKKISVLSHGEKSRLSLAKLALEKNDLLLLDEPTNHLDVNTKKHVIEALDKYKGTLIIVSHDEELLENIKFNRMILLPENRIEWL